MEIYKWHDGIRLPPHSPQSPRCCLIQFVQGRAKAFQPQASEATSRDHTPETGLNVVLKIRDLWTKNRMNKHEDVL